MKNRIIAVIALATVVGGTLYACAPDRSRKEMPLSPEEVAQLRDNVADVQEVTTMKTVDGLRIAWDATSEKTIIDRGGYSRVIRLSNGHYLAAIENPSGVVVSECEDGEVWSSPRVAIPSKTVTVGGRSVKLSACNAEIFELSDGTIVVGTNYRPAEPGIAPYSIGVARSTDNGKTFSKAAIIFEAGTANTEGCWEPAFLELPDGTLQCYFANESPYTSSKEQEISMLSSSDKGVSWTTEPVKVCFTAKHRDGMPVPRIIGDEIVVAIEDNGRGQLQPATVRCKIADNWSKPVLADDPSRSFAFPVSAYGKNVYMGAPYLLQLSTGETLLSYQTVYGRRVEWHLSCMEVATGDSNARNFTNTSRPFIVPEAKSGLWNSIMQWDENTVLAVSASDKGGQGAPWIKKGHLMRELKLGPQTQNQPNLFASELGKSETLLAGLGYSEGKFRFKAEVKDSKLFAGESVADGVWFYLDVVDGAYAQPYAGVYRIWVSCDAKQISICEGNNGRWEEIRLRGVEASSQSTDNGYMIDMTIDSSVFRHENGKTVRAACQLSAASSEYFSYDAFMYGSSPSKPATWLKLTL